MQHALEAFDQVGLDAPTLPAEPLLACYRDERETRGLLHELAGIRAAGHDVSAEQLTGEQARSLAPNLTGEIGAALRVRGQRYLDPPAYLRALAAAVVARGGTLREGTPVTGIQEGTDDVAVEQDRHDAVVLATGAWLGGLARRFGVRQVVQAGRGYSFSVPVEQQPPGPLYFPVQRVACTPLGDRLRIAGMMEFRRPGEPLDPRRIQAITDAVRPLLTAVDLDDRQDEWVGSRPCTGDGLPLLGRTASPRVFVSGGHGMWGIALGPITGRLVAKAVLEGETPPELRPFDPLR
jgi:D-amino-acid dehydrogenase